MAVANSDRHDTRAIAFFGTWMVTGLYLDGWAHQAQKPETFFSPWHFILYSGFGAAVAYFVFRERILKKRSNPDRLTTAGLVVFIVAAIGDGAWHEIFGIEVDLEALLSPTHLGLMIGGLLMLGIGYRSAMRNKPVGERADFSLIVTMTLCAAVIMFFLQFLNPFAFRRLWPVEAGGEDLYEIYPIMCVFAVNTVFTGLALLLVRRWRVPRGTFTFSFGALALGLVLLHGRRGQLLNVVAAAAAGLITDVLVMRLRPSADDVARTRIFSALVPVALWGLWFASIHLQEGMRWPAELWTGTIILAALEGVGLGILAVPRRHAAVTPPRSEEISSSVLP